MGDERNNETVAMNISLDKQLRDAMEEHKEVLGTSYIEQIERGLALYFEKMQDVLKAAKKVK